MGNASTISVIVPALDEERHIEAAVAEVTKAVSARFSDWEILLFNDGSRDRTGALMDQIAARDAHVTVVHNDHPRNLGGVYKQGIRMARFEYVLMVPGDNENPATALHAPLAAVGLADIVLPFPEDNAVRSPLRNALSSAYTKIVNALFGLDLPYYNGTVIHRTDLVRSVVIRTDSFAYQAEALVKLLAAGHSFVPVGITVVPRAGRKSKALRLKNLAGVAATFARVALEVRLRGRTTATAPGVERA
jgi:glycosyltransferase involved in cell wall biosynthesis